MQAAVAAQQASRWPPCPASQHCATAQARQGCSLTKIQYAGNPRAGSGPSQGLNEWPKAHLQRVRQLVSHQVWTVALQLACRPLQRIHSLLAQLGALAGSGASGASALVLSQSRSLLAAGSLPTVGTSAAVLSVLAVGGMGSAVAVVHLDAGGDGGGRAQQTPQLSARVGMHRQCSAE